MVRYLITAFMALALFMPAGLQAASVTFSAGDVNGTVTGTTPQNIAQGTSGTPVTAAPNTGFHFFNWSWANPADAGNPFGTTDNPLTFTVTGNEATDDVKAFFAPNFSQSVLVHGLSNIVDIKGGRSHTLALTSNGSVLQWGANGNKQGDIVNFGLKGAKAIAAGPYNSLAIDQNGNLVGSGTWISSDSTVANVVFDTTSQTPLAPVNSAANGIGIKAIAGGDAHALALLNDNTLVVVGDNADGQATLPPALLSSALTGANHPVVEAIAAGHYHSVALLRLSDGSSKLVAWGRRFEAQLGDLLALPSVNVACTHFDYAAGQASVPGQTSFCEITGINAAAVDARGYHTVVLTSDGKVVAFGANELGQGDVPANLAFGSSSPVKATAIAAGAHHTTVLLADKTVQTWGDNFYGERTTPAGLANVTKIAAGSYHNMALQGNTAVVLWGDDQGGQCQLPSLPVNPADPADGDFAPVTNGTVVCISTDTGQSRTTVPYNGATKCDITPAAGFSLTAFNVNGIPTTVTNNTITLSNVTKQQSITAIISAGQTITVTTHAPTSANYLQTFNVAATSSSGLAVAIAGSGGCSGSGSGSAPITMTSGVTACTVTYSQAGGGGVDPAPVVTETTTANKLVQTITFDTITNTTSGSGGLTLTATSNSNGTVTFTADPASSSVCSVSGTTVTILGVGTCTIHANLAGDSNMVAATTVTRSILVSAGVVDHFTVTAPATASAGTPFSVTITAVDSSNFPVTNFGGAANVTTNQGGSITPNSIGFINGVWTGDVKLIKAGSGQLITVADGTGKTGSATVDVASGPAETFSVVVPGSVDAGASFDFTVTARDQFNNVVSNYAGTVRFTSTDTAAATLPADYSFVAGDNGVHTFAATLGTAGSRTITVTDTSSSVAGTSNSVTVTPAAPKLVVTTNATATAGTPFPVTVSVKDNFGNTISDYTGTVHFTSLDSQAVLPADYTFTVADGGTHVFNGVVLKTGPTQTVTATDTVTAQTTGTSGSIQVAPTAPAALAFGQQPTSTVAGHPITPAVTVKVVDQFGNVVTTSNASITVAVAANPGSATLSGTATQMAQAGVATFPDLSLNRTGSGYTISAVSDTLTAATSNAFDISTGVLDHFTIASLGKQVLGVPFPITVTALDASGNTVSSFTGTVDLTATGGTVTPVTSGAFVNGAWTGNVTVPAAATGMTITAKDTNGAETGVSNAFDVAKGTQTITITSTVPVVAPFQGTFDVSATASSSLPVTITGSGACSGSGDGTATITIVSGSGTCDILFTQAGNASFDQAQIVSHVTAGKIQQSIAVDTAAPTSATFGSTFTVAAHAAGGAVTYSSAGGCTNSGATFTMTSATVACTVTYSQQGSDIYFPAQFSTTTSAVAALPGAPTIFSVKAANGQATIIFVAPSQTGGAPITGYTVTANPGNLTATGMNSPITITGLSNGTAYTFSVTAQNSAGSGPAAVSDAMTPVANGDINGDGVFDIRDAMLALRVATGLQAPTAAMLAAGDVAPLVNNVPHPDGKIDVGDVVVLLRKAVGLVTF